MSVSLAVSLALLAVKFLAYRITGSAAVLSDALESIINVVASGFGLYSVALAGKPPDKSHPYGHGRIEFFSAGFEGALIVLAAVAILYKALPQLLSPPSLRELNLGVGLVGGAAAVNCALGSFLVRSGRRSGSLALVADGRHILTDVWTSAGVVGALLLVRSTGWMILDPIVACSVAGHVLISGAVLVRASVGRLMDEADVEALARIVRALSAQRKPEWIELHHLRSWRSGRRHHTDFHLTLPRYWDLSQCHRTEKELERAVLDEIGDDGEVIVHFDPCTAVYCRSCKVEECPVRSEKGQDGIPWTLGSATGGPRHEYSPPSGDTAAA